MQRCRDGGALLDEWNEDEQPREGGLEEEGRPESLGLDGEEASNARDNTAGRGELAGRSAVARERERRTPGGIDRRETESRAGSQTERELAPESPERGASRGGRREIGSRGARRIDCRSGSERERERGHERRRAAGSTDQRERGRREAPVEEALYTGWILIWLEFLG